MELYHGRPTTTDGREEKEIRTYDFLDRLGIEYFRTDHFDNPAGSIDDCREIDACLGVMICKNLFLCNRKKTQYYLLMMPGDKTFHTKELSGQHDIPRLSFAPEERMEEFLDIRPGSVSIMGLMNDHENSVQLLIDEDIINDEYIGCHPCVNTSSLKIATKDILNVFLPAVHHEPMLVQLSGEA